MQYAFNNSGKPISSVAFNAVVGMSVYYNDRLEWVEKAVNSILAQSYQRFVLFITIDGEVSLALHNYLKAAEAREPRIVLYQCTGNTGLSVCMNFIIDTVSPFKPSYFFRMDADDISLEDRLQKQVDFLDSHPEVDVLGTALHEIDESGRIVGHRKLPLRHAQIVRLLPRRCTINHPTVCFRFSVLEDGYRYQEKLRNTQDYFMWITLAHAGYRFANLSDKTLLFRRVNDFYKRRGLTKSINEFKARIAAMQKLNRITFWNLTYACSVLLLRLLPAKVVKLAYKFDRLLLEKLIKH